MKKYKQLSLWFRFKNSLVRIFNRKLAFKKAIIKMYEDETQLMINRFNDMNFESEEQFEIRRTYLKKTIR